MNDQVKQANLWLATLVIAVAVLVAAWVITSRMDQSRKADDRRAIHQEVQDTLRESRQWRESLN